ncbi:MAG: HNH endonuclease [Verrucomicrobiales bacterium]
MRSQRHRDLSRTQFEVQAAHMVPLSKGGADDLRNGIALTGTLHWAFDRGFFGIQGNREVYVPEIIRGDRRNNWLAQFHGKAINEAGDPKYRVNELAIEWHLENVVNTLEKRFLKEVAP